MADYDPYNLLPPGGASDDAAVLFMLAMPDFSVLTSTVGNLLTSSEAFGAWNLQQVTASSDAAIAPNGTRTADKIIEASDTNNHHRLSQAITAVSGASYRVTVFGKAAERSIVDGSVWGNAAPASTNVVFSLAGNGSVLATGVGSSNSEIRSMGANWYRCRFRITAAASDTLNVEFGIRKSASELFYDGDGASGLYLWRAILVRL